MHGLLTYKTLPLWTAAALPAGFLQNHNTQQGTWAQLEILAGSLEFALTSETGDVLETFTFTPENQPPLIAPQQWHRIVSSSADLRCQLRFMCTPEDYPAKKYKLSRAHSEVVEALPRLALPAAARALDVGCGRGRNSLYLALHGLHVDGIDRNPEALQTLAEIIASENLGERIKLTETDFNQAGQQTLLQGRYDLILSTVVLMFLQADAARALIAQMQAATAPGGYNLIVSAMDTNDYPCTQPFPFTLREGELAAMYQGWELLKYNENPGHLHKTDAEGKPIALRFATMLARKPTSG